jgi:predicted outer membrane protein
MQYRLFILVISLQTVYCTVTSCSNNKNTVHIAEEIKGDSLGIQSVKQDAIMAVDLAELGYGEIELAKAARLRSGNKTIKDIAARLQTDQTRLMKGLKQYAANRNVHIPDSATAKDQRIARNMAANQSAVFDKKWCVTLLNRHEEMIAKMEEAATMATDSVLRFWINDALPTIRMHRDELMQLKYKLR